MQPRQPRVNAAGAGATGPDGYEGPVLVRVADAEHPARASLYGRFEPVDGRYHWGGRIAPLPDLAAAVRAGARVAALRVAGGPAREVRLAEVDPWGGVKVAATGAPPWPAPYPRDA